MEYPNRKELEELLANTRTTKSATEVVEIQNQLLKMSCYAMDELRNTAVLMALSEHPDPCSYMAFLKIVTEAIFSGALEEAAAEFSGDGEVVMAISLSCSLGVHDVTEVAKRAVGFSTQAKERFIYDLKESILKQINSNIPWSYDNLS